MGAVKAYHKTMPENLSNTPHRVRVHALTWIPHRGRYLRPWWSWPLLMWHLTTQCVYVNELIAAQGCQLYFTLIADRVYLNCHLVIHFSDSVLTLSPQWCDPALSPLQLNSTWRPSSNHWPCSLWSLVLPPATPQLGSIISNYYSDTLCISITSLPWLSVRSLFCCCLLTLS